jgi:hypothetical protein
MWEIILANIWEIVLTSIITVLGTAGVVTVKVFYPEYDYFKIEYIAFFRKGKKSN